MNPIRAARMPPQYDAPRPGPHSMLAEIETTVPSRDVFQIVLDEA